MVIQKMVFLRNFDFFIQKQKVQNITKTQYFGLKFSVSEFSAGMEWSIHLNQKDRCDDFDTVAVDTVDVAAVDAVDAVAAVAAVAAATVAIVIVIVSIGTRHITVL